MLMARRHDVPDWFFELSPQRGIEFGEGGVWLTFNRTEIPGLFRPDQRKTAAQVFVTEDYEADYEDVDFDYAWATIDRETKADMLRYLSRLRVETAQGERINFGQICWDMTDEQLRDWIANEPVFQPVWRAITDAAQDTQQSNRTEAGIEAYWEALKGVYEKVSARGNEFQLLYAYDDLKRDLNEWKRNQRETYRGDLHKLATALGYYANANIYFMKSKFDREDFNSRLRDILNWGMPTEDTRQIKLGMPELKSTERQLGLDGLDL